MSQERMPGIDPEAEPSGPGCLECSSGEAPGWWFHLRRCAACGHIGCCDSSPGQHGSQHVREAGHPILTSFEPGEEWFWDATTDTVFQGPQLAAPTSHPVSQPTPGPAGKVPPDWQLQLH